MTSHAFSVFESRRPGSNWHFSARQLCSRLVSTRRLKRSHGVGSRASRGALPTRRSRGDAGHRGLAIGRAFLRDRRKGGGIVPSGGDLPCGVPGVLAPNGRSKWRAGHGREWATSRILGTRVRSFAHVGKVVEGQNAETADSPPGSTPPDGCWREAREREAAGRQAGPSGRPFGSRSSCVPAGAVKPAMCGGDWTSTTWSSARKAAPTSTWICARRPVPSLISGTL